MVQFAAIVLLQCASVWLVPAQADAAECEGDAGCVIPEAIVGASLLQLAGGGPAEEEEAAEDASYCKPENLLMIHDFNVKFASMEGKGSKGILVQDVLPLRSKGVNMIVTTVGEYVPWDTSKTGVDGRVISINQKTNTSAQYRIQFLDADNWPSPPGPVVVTFAGIDRALLNAVEEITLGKKYEYWLPKRSELEIVDAGADRIAFRGVKFLKHEPPRAVNPLPNDQRDMTVSILVPDGDWEVVFSFKSSAIMHAYAGRNFAIGGASDAAC